MAGEIQTTIVGNVGGDVELRFTQGGVAVASLSVGVTPRTFDKSKNEFTDGETTWVRVNVWRDMAENVAASLVKGSRVVAYGRLQNRKWQDKDGNNRYSLEMEADAIGPDLRYAQALVQKIQRDRTPQYSAAQAQADEAWGQPQAEAPWEQPSQTGTPQAEAGGQQAWLPSPDDETPF